MDNPEEKKEKTEDFSAQADQSAAKKPTFRERRAKRKERIHAKRAEKVKKVRLFPANKKGYHVMHFFRFLKILLCPLHFLIFPYKLHGHKKVGKGAYIYVGNHYTIWDVFYPARTTWEGIHYLAKQSVLVAPVFNWWAQEIGAIGALRDGSDVRTVMEAMRVLKNGEKINCFPEGTRNKTGGEEFLPFHGGAALLSIKTKSPIQPFVICNRPRVFRLTHVVFGEPFEFTEYYDRKLTNADYEAADEELKNRLYALRDEFRASRKKGKKGGK